MDEQPLHSPDAARLVPRIIAVGAEWAAGTTGAASAAALIAGQPLVGGLMLTLSAAFLAAKNWSQLKTATESQATVERQLNDLIQKHRSLFAALDAIETDQHLQELFSRERTNELKQLLRQSHQEIEHWLGDHQEVTFHLARFVERWCSDQGVKLAELEQSITNNFRALKTALEDGFNQNQAALTDALTGINDIRSRLAPLPPGAVPTGLDVRVVSWHAAAGEFNRFSEAQLIEDCRRRMLEHSVSVLRWQRTVGTGHHRIAPSIEGELVASILNVSSSTHLVLGPKGVGKSALTGAVGNALQQKGFVVFGIRADRLSAEINSIEDLRRHFGLALSTADAIRLIAKSARIVLIVDQLDSVSELTDRRSNRLNLLLDLVRELSGTQNLHIVAACREFDFQHDARLSTIGAEELRIKTPDWPEVAHVLAAEGHSPDLMAEPMRELLRTPWNLNLFLRVAQQGETFGSMQSLLEAVWVHDVTCAGGPAGRDVLVERIARRMSEQEELFVPVSLADDLPASRDALLREEILVPEADGHALAFRHQTFYDYTLARMFARGDVSLANHVLKHQDGLFVRPAMLNGLGLLRDSSRRQYHREVQRILDDGPRQHVRSLLLEFVAGQPDPDDTEAAIILPLIFLEDGPLILRAASGSRGWFLRLRASGDLIAWMKQPLERAALCAGMLIGALAFDADGVCELVADLWGSHREYDHLLVGVAQYVRKWDVKWCELACNAVNRSIVEVMYLAGRVVESEPALAARLVRAELDRKFDEAEAKTAALASEAKRQAHSDVLREYLSHSTNNPFAQLIDSKENDHYGLELIAQKAPRPFMEAVWPWFVKVIERIARPKSDRLLSYVDDWATYISYDLHPIPIVKAVHVAADGWAAEHPASFDDFAVHAGNCEMLVAHRVLAQAYAIVARASPHVAFDYLIQDPRRLVVGTHHDVHCFSTNLIGAVHSALTLSQRSTLEQALLHFDAFLPNAYVTADPALRFRMKKWSREHRLRLLRAIPGGAMTEELLAIRESEEIQLPGTQNFDRDAIRFGAVGPRMTADELSKATNDEILALLDSLAAYENDGFGRAFRTDVETTRSGGSREQSRALGLLAETQGPKVLLLLNRLSATRADHQLYAGAIVEGIGKSTLACDDVFLAIKELDARGFDSDEFRERCASTIQERAKRKERPDQSLISKLVEWLHEIIEPSWPDDEGPKLAGDRKGPVLFRRGGFMSPLMSGRAEVFRAISAVFGEPDYAGAAALLQVARSRIAEERHPRVIAEILMFLHPAFTVASAIKAATSVFMDLVDACPASLQSDAALHAVATLTGFFQPDAAVQKCIMHLYKLSDARSRQAFGEILFLYFGRRLMPWASERIGLALGSEDGDVLLGLGYGAADGWLFSHCRDCGTDILSTIARRPDAEFHSILELAFVPIDDAPFPCDAFTRRVVDAACSNPAALCAAGAQMLEALMPAAGTQPTVLLMLGKSLVSAAAGNLSALSGRASSLAANLTNLAITLHRQERYRAAGLELFEELLRLGVAEAAAALSLLDRKPYQDGTSMPLPMRPRRRRR
jgi:hypothetical protein